MVRTPTSRADREGPRRCEPRNRLGRLGEADQEAFRDFGANRIHRPVADGLSLAYFRGQGEFAARVRRLAHGLPGSGKSTLASLLASEASRQGIHVEILDGEVVRTNLSKGLGFSREDRDTHIRRIGFVARLVARSGACVIAAAISPYRETRDEQRRAIGRFCEVYCQCPIGALQRRDPKGLYARALAGEIEGFTGVDAPYEPPLSPEVVVRTDRESPAESLAKIVSKLEALGYLLPLERRGHAGRKYEGPRQPHGPERIEFAVRGRAPLSDSRRRRRTTVTRALAAPRATARTAASAPPSFGRSAGAPASYSRSAPRRGWPPGAGTRGPTRDRRTRSADAPPPRDR